MLELEDFLNFVFENLNDPRIELHKKMKYGYRHYFINITLKYPVDNHHHQIRDSKTLQIIVDCRNNCIEVGQWEELTVFESPELTKKWADKLEEVYNKNIISELQLKVSKFFDNVDPKDRDFGRRWKMKDMFNEDEDEENPTE
jgi:hypothetical protein